MRTFKIVNGDVVYDTAGQPKLVEDTEKLRQDWREVLSIETQENGYGAGLDSLMGELTNDTQRLESFQVMVHQKIIKAVERWKYLQRISRRGCRTNKELVNKIGTLRVWQDPTTPIVYRFRAGVLSENFILVQATGTL